MYTHTHTHTHTRFLEQMFIMNVQLYKTLQKDFTNLHSYQQPVRVTIFPHPILANCLEF